MLLREGGWAEWEIKRETGRQEESLPYLILAQSNMEKDSWPKRGKDQIGRDSDDEKHKEECNLNLLQKQMK